MIRASLVGLGKEAGASFRGLRLQGDVEFQNIVDMIGFPDLAWF